MNPCGPRKAPRLIMKVSACITTAMDAGRELETDTPGRRGAEARTCQSIIEGIRRRDPRAALLLHDQFGTLINKMVWRLLGADTEHDDVVQQIFVNILEAIEDVRAPEALKGWILSVTVNAVRRELRMRKYRRIFRLVPEVPEQRDFSAADPEKKLFAAKCYEVLGRLGTEERIVFTLRYVEGCTLEEIGEACHCSLATVKRRIAKARRKFIVHASKDPDLSSMLGEVHDD
jgi:RNA polymerase sigma-70 factor (ECF subfamily)